MTLERESKHCFLKKNVDNNNLTSKLLQNVLLEESSVDEGYTNSWSSGVQFSPKCRWSFQYSFYNIEKNRSPSAFSWGKRWWYSPYCPLNWLISWTQLLSLFNFNWTFSEAIRRRGASSFVSSIIATGLQSAPLICLHPTIPTCRQAAGRSAPILGIGVGTWICLHYTRTLRRVLVAVAESDY